MGILADSGNGCIQRLPHSRTTHGSLWDMCRCIWAFIWETFGLDTAGEGAQGIDIPYKDCFHWGILSWSSQRASRSGVSGKKGRSALSSIDPLFNLYFVQPNIGPAVITIVPHCAVTTYCWRDLHSNTLRLVP